MTCVDDVPTSGTFNQQRQTFTKCENSDQTANIHSVSY